MKTDSLLKFKKENGVVKINFLGIKISHKTKSSHQSGKIKKLAKKVAKKIKNKEKIKVYFLIYDQSQWTFQSLYDAMEKDNVFEPYVLIFPAWVRNIEKDANLNLLNFVKNLNLRYVTEICEDNLPDIIFTTMSHYNLKNVPLDIERLHDKVLFCFHIYGWLLTNDDNVYFSNNNFQYFWKEYVPTLREYNVATKEGPLKGSSVVCSGYLKSDCFYNAKNTSDLWKKQNTKKIIYAPHYSLYKGGHSFATFDLYYEKLFDYLKEHSEIEIILKPHPLLRKFIGDENYKKPFGCTRTDFITLEEYDLFIERWENLPNGGVMNSGNYYELFNSSDAMILDSESFVAEYMIQNKPICFCNKYDSIASIKSFMNPMGEDLFDAMTIAQTWNDIKNFIENVVENIDIMKPKREKMINKYLNVNKNHVGEFIKNDIKSSLK